jgi:hypothetical protein
MTVEFENLVGANESMINSTKMMFRMYKLKFEQEIKKITDEGRYPTYDDVNRITRELSHIFPLIKAPNSSTREEGIAINDQDLVSKDPLGIEAGRVRYKNANNKDASMIVQYMIRELSEAGASGAVIPIHWIDGTIIGKALIKGDILGIHDAIIAGKDPVEAVTNMNKAMYDVNSKYNLIKETYLALVQSAQALTKEELSMIEPIDEDYTLKTTIEGAAALSDYCDTTRKWLYSHKLYVGNVAGPIGTHYEGSAKEMEISDIINPEVKFRKVLTKNLTKIIDKAIEECK